MLHHLTSSSLGLAATVAAALFSYKYAAPLVKSSGATIAFILTYATVSYLSLFLARNRIFVPTQFLPSILVARFVDRERLIETFPEVQKQNNDALGTSLTSRRVKIDSFGGAVLDGYEITSQPSRTKWVVWFNANGVVYEQILDFLDLYSRQVDANVLVFNYRGVGASTGWPATAMHLTEDGISAVNFLQSQGVSEKHILLHGHSIGGAVMAHVASYFPKVKVVSDRSFSSLTDECVVMMKGPLRYIMGLFLGVASSGLLALTAKMGGEFAPSSMQTASSLLLTLPAGAVAGWLAAKFGAMEVIAPSIIRMFEWDMNAASYWRKERSLILYHKRDGIIPYPVSLHASIFKQGLDADQSSYELTARGDPQFNHMHRLDSSQHDWNHVAKLIKDLHDD